MIGGQITASSDRSPRYIRSVVQGFFIIIPETDMDERTTSGGASSSSSSGSKTTAKQTIKSGESGSLSGYMVASGEGAMACQVGDTVFEGDYQGSEGDPCTVNISVE